MKTFIRKWKNARLAVAQIKAGEWKPLFNPITGEHLTAERGERVLWLGNGAWFCEIRGGRYFGLILRHYVWWAAARRLKYEADYATGDLADGELKA